jgi:hypothetical protein
VQVTDIRVAPSVYYQGFTLLNLIYVHTVIRCLPGKHSSEWYVVSSRLLRPLHWFIHRKITSMNDVQNAEDVLIRDRRAELRKRGYDFTPATPDFVTANRKTNNVVAPPLAKPFSVPVKDMPAGRLNTVTEGSVELLVRPDGKGGCSVWNGVCPHEGGPLAEGEVNGDEIRCAWHGLKFKCAALSKDKPRAKLGELSLDLDGDRIGVS